MAKENPVERYRSMYGYRDLTAKHSLDEFGTWEILGEDPNCDLGGHHHQPQLEIVEGRLGDVIEYAVFLPGFWQWGGGGSIRRYDSPKIKKVNSTTARERARLRERIEELQKALKEAEDALEDL